MQYLQHSKWSITYCTTTEQVSVLTETSSSVYVFFFFLFLTTKPFRQHFLNTQAMCGHSVTFPIFLLWPFKSPICSCDLLYRDGPRPLQPSRFPLGPLHFIISAISFVISGHQLLTRHGRLVKQAWLNALCPSISLSCAQW